LVEAAELIKEVIPCAEKVRFVNTGTEAATAAARVVRAYTGKKKIVKFLGHYHGQDDQFLIAASGNKPTPGSAGIPEEHLVNTVLVKFNDINAIRRKLDEDNDIAAVFADPQLSRGSWTPSPGYLQELRKLTQEHGVLLVFDEIQTGFRLALGGAQEYFGVVPDLAFFAKGIAGGEKIAVLCGKEDVMGTISGAKGIAGSTAAVVTQSGTFNDGTGALAACIAGIKAFKKLKAEGAYESIFQLGSKLKAGIEQAFHDRGLPCHVNNLGPTTHVFITDLEPDFDAYCALDRTVLILFHLSLINEGLLFTNPQNGVSILSFAHTEEDIQRMIDGTGSALDNYRFAEAL
jgi:glutamate-1-semialdehyde 2,1-aminomutase